MAENADKYHCPSCRELMTDACQTAICGHRFCKRCLEQLFVQEERTGRPAKCPKSDCQVTLRGEDGIKYFPDRCFQKEVRQLCITKCKLKKCKWVGTVGRLEDHMTKDHPSYSVKPVECSKATHIMVDVLHMDATHSMHHHIKKLTGEMSHAVKVLEEALDTQKHSMDHVVRVNIEDEQPNAVHTQSTVCPRRPTLQECSMTQTVNRPFNLMMGEVEPEMDTSALTQVDQAMANLHGQQVQAMKCTFDQLDIGMNAPNKQLSIASSKLQPIISNPSLIVGSTKMSESDQVTTLQASPIPVPKMVNQYSQTMVANHPPSLPLKTKHTGSATLPQQTTAPLLDCPPRSYSASSGATVIKTPSESSCNCSMCEMTRKELEDKESKLATEKGKSMTMQNILKEELQLKPTKLSSHETLRKRVFSVPTKKMSAIS